MTPLPTVLVVDDDPGVVAWLVDLLPEEGFHATGETSARRALHLLETQTFDLVVSDVEMPEMRGLELLRNIHRVRPKQAVLLVTAFGSVDLAMESVRAGAVDFLTKPFRVEALALSMKRALRERQLLREISRLREVSAKETPSGIAARSPCMQHTLDLARRAARSHLPVLVTGESGVGKGVLARFIHDNSERSSGPFVHLNCAALPPGLAESELFGVRRGAFTDAREDRPGVFAQAHDGTLFLDEVGDLPLEQQPKLLQALESNRVRPLGGTEDLPADVRIVAATNRPLEEALRERRFRPDLYHRLNVVRIEVPPLRERPEDLELIIDQILHEAATRSGRPSIGLSPDAIRKLKQHRWPGNIRELVNAVERALALTDDELLKEGAFALQPVHEATGMLARAVEHELSLDELEREYIRGVLARTGGHKARAAKILGLDRRTLYKKAAELAGEPRKFGKQEDASDAPNPENPRRSPDGHT